MTRSVPVQGVAPGRRPARGGRVALLLPRTAPDRRAGSSADDREQGGVMVLSLGYFVLAMLLVTVVVSATALHLERTRLLHLADALALEAADAADRDSMLALLGRPGGHDEALPLTDRAVRDAVEGFLQDNPQAAGIEGLRIVEASADGGTVAVRLTALARPALISWITAPFSDGIEIHGEARSRAW